MLLWRNGQTIIRPRSMLIGDLYANLSGLAPYDRTSAANLDRASKDQRELVGI
jgi:hypothetical protein